MTENQKAQDNKSWQEAIAPGLQSRLMLPITQPGMLDHQLTNSIIERIEKMISGPQLAVDINQRWQTQEATRANLQPVVFAKPAQSQSSPEIKTELANKPTSTKSVVQAKRAPYVSKLTSEPVAGTSKSTPVHENKGVTVVLAKKAMPSINKFLTQGKQESPVIEPKNLIQEKIIQKKAAPKQTVKNKPPGIQLNNESSTQIDDHLQVPGDAQTQTDSSVYFTKQPIDSSNKPVIRPLDGFQRATQDRSISAAKRPKNSSQTPSTESPFPDSKVIQRVALPNTNYYDSEVKTQMQAKVTPIVKKSNKASAPLTVQPITVQPKYNSNRKAVSQQSASLPLVMEIRKNNQPQQNLGGMAFTDRFTRANQSPNPHTLKATPFAKNNGVTNIKSSSASSVIQRMPMKSTQNSNGFANKDVIQRRPNPDSSGLAENIDIAEMAEEIESRLLEKLSKTGDTDEMLERMEHNFMRKLAIENERRGWRR